MTDGVKIHFKSKIGIQVQKTTVFCLPRYEIPLYLKTTWAEKMRNKLRWKLKCRTAWFNRFLFWILLLPVCLLEAIGLLFLYGVLDNYIHGTIVGSFGAIFIIEVWIITFILLNEYFETDPNFIRLKR